MVSRLGLDRQNAFSVPKIVFQRDCDCLVIYRCSATVRRFIKIRLVDRRLRLLNMYYNVFINCIRTGRSV